MISTIHNDAITGIIERSLYLLSSGKYSRYIQVWEECHPGTKGFLIHKPKTHFLSQKRLIASMLPLTKSNRFCMILDGEWYSFKIKYRFQVLVPKRQILPCAVMRIIRSALTCLSVPFTTSTISIKYQRNGNSTQQKHLLTADSELIC